MRLVFHVTFLVGLVTSTKPVRTNCGTAQAVKRPVSHRGANGNDIRKLNDDVNGPGGVLMATTGSERDLFRHGLVSTGSLDAFKARLLLTSKLAAVRRAGHAVEPVSQPSHASLTIDKHRQHRVDSEFVEKRWLFVCPERDIGTPGTPLTRSIAS
jgi:hypothetical protein